MSGGAIAQTRRFGRKHEEARVTVDERGTFLDAARLERAKIPMSSPAGLSNGAIRESNNCVIKLLTYDVGAPALGHPWYGRAANLAFDSAVHHGSS
jgi:hypothetical protein